VNVAILRGDQLQLVDAENVSVADCSALSTFMPGKGLPASTGETDSVLVELAAAMRSHGRGGLVLVVPPDSEGWRSSIVQPISYPVVPPFTMIAELQEQRPKLVERLWQEELLRAIDIVGGYTAVDGATVINRQYHLLAFGAKVTPANGSLVEKMVITEPVVDSVPRYLHPAQNGGTRHLAAAQFVHDQRDALALVASQDGFFTVFAWSEKLQMVHAHRIDVLLL
jgi:hypothetical protein